MMSIAAQSLLIILLAVIAVLTWQGRKLDPSWFVRSACWVLSVMLVVFSIMPAVQELFVVMEGIEPSWTVRFETFVALGLIIWRGAWSYG